MLPAQKVMAGCDQWERVLFLYDVQCNFRWCNLNEWYRVGRKGKRGLYVVKFWEGTPAFSRHTSRELVNLNQLYY